jgi:hypothetical protein
VDLLTTVLTLPMSLGAAAVVHVLASRAVKAVLWSVSPLATGEPQAFTYERNPWRTAEPHSLQLMAAVAVAGVIVWIGAVRASGWLIALGLLVWAGALALDLLRWERVAASANNLWFQRGLGQTVHQIAYENIRDVAVEERDARGFTLAHGTKNRICRLQVRMKDKRVVALPKADAHSGLGDVESVANQVRQRLVQLDDRLAVRRSADQGSQAAAAVAQAPAAQGEEAELRRALRRLRKGALAPDVPQAVKLPHDA